MKGRIPRINIDDYPAVKAHLDQFWDKISKRTDKGDTPYNLRNCAYLEDFLKPKIVYSEIVQSPQFYFDADEHFYPEATTFILTGEHLDFLIHLLNSPIVAYFFKTFYAGGGLGTHGYRYKKEFLQNLPIPKPLNKVEITDRDIVDLYNLSEDEMAFIQSQRNQ